MIRNFKIGPIITALILLIFFWQLIIWIGNYPEALLPSPLTVGEAIVSLTINGTIFTHIGISLYRFSIGYFSAAIIAIALGLFLGKCKFCWSIIDPLVQLLRPVSPIAWSPFIVLWFGIGNMPAIAIIFIAAFFPIMITTVSAVRKIDPTYLMVAENLELSTPALLWKVILPASFPSIVNGLHIALGTAWIFLVSGEMVGAQSGLGYLIVDARNSLSLNVVLASIFLIGFIGLLLDKCIHVFEWWVFKLWGGTSINS